jgi:ribonuclease HII
MVERARPSLIWEGSLWQQGILRVAGVDEVGRGALAGPVVAAAVILPAQMDPKELEGVRDSKQLRPQQRAQWAERIRQVALAVGIGSASAAEIDRLNIRRATVLAMQRALAELDPIDHILVDGLPLAELGSRQTALVKGGSHQPLHCRCFSCGQSLARCLDAELGSAVPRLRLAHQRWLWHAGAPTGVAELGAHPAAPPQLCPLGRTESQQI